MTRRVNKARRVRMTRHTLERLATLSGCLAAFFVVLSSCSARDESVGRAASVDWASGEDSTEVRRLVEAVPACVGCIRLEVGAVLGDRSGPGYVVHTTHVVRDSVGRYWLGQYRDMVKVFEADGSYVATVGRPGEGPEEFGMPAPIFTDADGLVHIRDAGNVREAVVGPDLAIRATTRFPFRPRSIAPLPFDGEYAVNAPTRAGEALGDPLHIIRGSDVVRSFGGFGGVLSEPGSMVRIITTDGAGRIYSARTTEFAVEVWSYMGRRIVGFAGPFLQEGDPDFDRRIRTGAATSALTDMTVDDSERLWLLMLKPRDDWQDHMISEPRRGGGIAVRPEDDDVTKVYSSRIVVVDLAKGAIIARVDRDELFTGFVGTNSLIESRVLDDGTPLIAIWNLELQNSPTNAISGTR
jgi:hypothetical protein